MDTPTRIAIEDLNLRFDEMNRQLVEIKQIIKEQGALFDRLVNIERRSDTE